MKNISKLFLNQINKQPTKIILKQKENNAWKSYTYQDLLYKINDCTEKLNDYNINKNDHVIYKGKNSIDWVAWNMAVLSKGAVWIPIYQNQNNSYINHIINDSKSKIIIHDDKYYNYNKNIINHYSNVKKIKKDFYTVDHNDLSHIIYTSGTSGKPKGVMLSHQNLLSNIDSIQKRFIDLSYKKNLKTFNILPWAHIYSLNTELYYNLFQKNIIYINSDQNQFLKELSEVQPHLLYLVPRILEEIHKKIKFLDKPIFNKLLPFILKNIFGENLITIFMGGAKLHAEDAHFFFKNNINICEGYGTTEASPMISVNHITYPRDKESVGAILDDIDLKIINNEICVSGLNVCQGYWNDDQKNKESFIEYENKKYYKTGDLGRIKYNFLYYIGRKSNNYKLSNGKFVSVDYYERKIKSVVKNTQLMLYGDNKQFNIIIMEECNQYNKKFEKEMLLKEINRELPKFAYVKDILFLKKDTFIRFLTPKMSLKKKELINYYQEEINHFYESL